ncbi:MAG: TatD family hydrolase [Clostridiales bacterium]|jgi:TatD DNase family protein|nr:TatD family hydrolase [Clostridiales bacterium]
MFFESHAHYDDARYDQDREELLASLPASQVTRVINVGTDIRSSLAAIKLSERFDFIYAAVGVHPHEASSLDEENFALLEGYCACPKAVALGEIGLDFHYDHSPRDTQRLWFKRQMELAGKTGLPVIIHSREAAAETFEMIAQSGLRRGVIHCYSGGVPMALDYIKMGFALGIGGVVTFENSKTLKEVVEAAPLDALLLETDCPYLTPAPFRKQRNDSRYLTHIAAKIAELKKTTPEAIASATAANASKLFGVPL